MINKLKRFEKLVRYALFGGMGVSSDMLVYTILVVNGFPYQLGNASGYFTGTLLSFFLNRKYTFNVKNKVLARMSKFFFVAFLGYGLSVFLLHIFVVYFQASPIIAKIMTLVFVLFFQFTLNSKITFRE